MAAGVPLDDDDRWPWLAALRMAMRDEPQASSPARRSGAPTATRCARPATSASSTSPSRGTRSPGAPGCAHRPLHARGMVESQFETLEPRRAPTRPMSRSCRGETADGRRGRAALATLRPGHRGRAAARADGGRPGDHADELESTSAASPATRSSDGAGVLLVPPDHTRLHSRSGEIAGCLYETLTAAGCEVGGAARARHPRRDEPGRGEAALRRPVPVRAHRRAPLARRRRPARRARRPTRSRRCRAAGSPSRSRSRSTSSSSTAGTSSSRSARSCRTRWSARPASPRTS